MKKIITLLITCLCSITGSYIQAQEMVKVKVLGGQAPADVKANIEQQASTLLSIFNEAILEDGKKCKDKLNKAFGDKTPEGKALVKSVWELWEKSPINCSVDEVESPVLKLYGNKGYQMRDIPVNVLDADMDNSFQDLVLSFDVTGKLTEVNMALEKHNYNNVIINGVAEEDLIRRQLILDFIEVFRTAYNRKDIDYLRQVYSDDALIITGTMLKKKKNDDSGRMMLANLHDDYDIVVQNKKEYMEKLSKIFKKNSYINIKFEEVSVVQSNTNDNIYGVTLKQYWNTSTYSDVGWLFLLINFENFDQPSIEVRTWQPNEFQGRTITRDEVFKLDNFNIK